MKVIKLEDLPIIIDDGVQLEAKTYGLRRGPAHLPAGELETRADAHADCAHA